MRKWLLAAVLAALPASVQAMDVQTFLTKAEALKGKGMFAMMSSDMSVLKSEIRTNAAALRAEADAAKAAGRPAPYCLPTPANLNSDEILASFRSIPEAQRPRTPVKEGLRNLFTHKYPCR